MSETLFDPFQLVGGTALSLQIGHRESVDIDLFTDAEYSSVDFVQIHHWFQDHYNYVDSSQVNIIGPGTSYFVGHSEIDAVKIDIYYTDNFIRPVIIEDGIRLTSLEDIIAMKLEVVGVRKISGIFMRCILNTAYQQ